MRTARLTATLFSCSLALAACGPPVAPADTGRDARSSDGGADVAPDSTRADAGVDAPSSDVPERDVVLADASDATGLDVAQDAALDVTPDASAVDAADSATPDVLIAMDVITPTDASDAATAMDVVTAEDASDAASAMDARPDVAPDVAPDVTTDVPSDSASPADVATDTPPVFACGFTATGTTWPLPTEFVGQFGLATDQDACGSSPDVLHTTVDLTGDGRPDLVVTSGCYVDDTLGRTRWRLYRNTGAGFAATGEDWALPTEFVGQFGITADQRACGSSPDVLHSLTDLTGDGLPDLVVTSGCYVDATIGRARWRVFRNTGTGFAATGEDWSLPTEHVGQFGLFTDQDACGSSPDVLHTTFDIDGDRRPDLVVTSGCYVDDTIGRARWRVFRNTGAGFAGTGTDWALPTEFVGQFALTADQDSCGSSPDVLHVTQDLTGEGRPDLVVTSGCYTDDTIGRARWRVFANSGTGFAATGSDWALPTEFVGQFGLTVDQRACGSSPDVLHALTDLTGEGLPDLVVTSGCYVDSTIGRARWRVFRNSGTGFDAAGTDYGLPADFAGQFALTADLASCGSSPDVLHMTTDLTGEGRADLVVTSGCYVDDTIGRARWVVFPVGACTP